MIRLPLRHLALPIAIALIVSLGACESNEGAVESSSPAVDPASSAPASPPDPAIPADTSSPVVDPAPMRPPVSGDPTSPQAGGRQCDERKASTAVGELARPSMVDRVVADTGSRTARVIKPGHAVTMDYSDQRVNIHVDAGNVITSVTCG